MSPEQGADAPTEAVLTRIAGREPTLPHPGAAHQSHVRPSGLAVDAHGALLLADFSQRFLKVGSDGRLAGLVRSGPDGVPAKDPLGFEFVDGTVDVAVHGDDIYLATWTQVFRLTREQGLRLVAGTGEPGKARPGPAERSPLSIGGGIAVDSAGSVFIADPDHHQVLRVGPEGGLEVVAGSGQPAQSGPVSNGPATSRAITPRGITVGPDDAMYLTSYVQLEQPFRDDGIWYSTSGGVLLRLAGGALSQVAGTGHHGQPESGTAAGSPLTCPSSVDGGARGVVVADGCSRSLVTVTPDGRLEVLTQDPHGDLSHFTRPGPLEAARLHPAAVAMGPDGVVYAGDTEGSLFAVKDGQLTLVAGEPWGDPRQGDPLAASLSVDDTAVGRDGTLYLADSGNDLVTTVSPDGRMRVIAGTGQRGSAVDGPALQSPLDSPESVDVDAAGNVFVGLHGSFQVVRISPDGRLTTLPYGGGTMSDLAADEQGGVFVVDCGTVSVWRVTPDADQELVLDGQSELPEPARPGEFFPWSAAVTETGDLLVGDTGNGLVLEVKPDRRIKVLAGVGNDTDQWFLGVGESAEATSVRTTPWGLDVGPNGAIYVADGASIERLDPDGRITAIADNGFDVGWDRISRNAHGISVGGDGTVYLSAWGSDGVFRLDVRSVPTRRDVAVSMVETRKTQRSIVIRSRVTNLGGVDEADVLVEALDRRGNVLAHRSIGVSSGAAKVVTLRVPIRLRGTRGAIRVDGMDVIHEVDEANNLVRLRF